MRKALTLIIALTAVLFPAVLLADNVTPEKALATARAYFNAGADYASPSGNDLTLVWTGDATKAGVADENPAFYVFNRAGNGGFIIIAGDDSITPVLAYSKSGSFKTEGMPANVVYWFNHFSEYIKTGVQRGYKFVNAASGDWADAGVDKTSVVKKIDTPSWGQSSPYNDMCPKDNGVRSYTGCVATAMAEILRTIQWPDKGEGTIPAYTTSSQSISIPANTLGHEYDYDLMPMSSASSSWSTAARTQVAQLMYDCGTMVQMDYTNEGSGTASQYVAPALIKYMKIDGSVSFEEADMYSDEQWQELLKSELDAGRPIYYSAVDESNSSGHAFVLDGYDSDGRFHINFGWDGYANAYFAFPNFGRDDYKFCNYHDAVINIKKDEGGVAASRLSFVQYYNDDKGLSTDCDDIQIGEEFTINMEGFLYNSSSVNFNGLIAMARVDCNGNFKEIISGAASASDLKPLYGFQSIDFTCEVSDLEEEDVAMLYYQLDGQSTWIQCPYQHATGFTGALILKPKFISLPDNTDIKFTRESGLLEISTLETATVSLNDPSGIAVKISGSKGKYSVRTASLPRGTYTLTLNYEKQTSTLEIVL